MNNFISLYKKSSIQVRATLWFMICSLLQKGISVITTPIFTRIMTTSEYGRYNVFASWLGIVSIFVSLNLSAGVYQQGLIKYDKEKDTFSSALQGLTMTIVAGATLLYLLFHEIINEFMNLTTKQVLAMLCLIWTSSVFSFWAAEQRTKYKYKALVIITLIVSLIKPILGVFLVLTSDDKVSARIWGLVLVEIIGYTGCFYAQMKKGRKFFWKKFWKYALCYNLPLIPHYLSQVVLNCADRIMINDLVGESQAGIYSLAYSLAMLMTLFSGVLSQTLSPWIYQKIKDGKISEIASLAYKSMVFIAGVCLLLIAFAPEAVYLFAPKSYHEALYCVPPIAMSVLFMYSYDLFAKFAFYYEKTTWIMYASISGAILNILLNYIGLKIFGYEVAAYTTLICFIFYDIFHYLLMRRICNTYLNGNMPYNVKVLLGIYALFLFCGFSLLFTYKYSFVRYSIIIVIVFVVILKKDIIVSCMQKLIMLNKNV